MEQLKFENQVCFPLYAASRTVTAAYRPLLEKLGLTYPQYLVLLLLWETKALTVKQLGEKLWLDSGTLTPLLKRMEKKGLIRRERSKADERVVDILLTDAGVQLRRKAAKVPGQLLDELRMDAQELMTLKLLLNKIVDHVEPR
ncbi:MarR family transcriptional regulator [Chitinophaga pendula]|uniref:MarR family winged helix-turn-helix transcriptional regulator n=1 Tax=Chitinophaga TaxID=79328 RepID=UPI000BAFD017|nr:MULTISPECIES: MarR family transcriptional regulator [Chitinophaga]ASZ12945.1 MarR family transcriptional regulator [Chitinophaga sp. MD30]UCJ09425.1 MarR family transcriptional regulator [Chitinophaga pendula]